MENKGKQMWKGLLFIMMAVAFAMALVCPALAFLFPPFCLVLFFTHAPALQDNAGYLTVRCTVCKIE